MNLKNLEQVKELVDDSLECINQIDELLAEELAFSEGPDSSAEHGGDPEPSLEGLGDRDTPEDPLAEARVQCTRVFSNLAEILDITEPFRKKYEAARIQANGGPRTTRERARMLSQLAIDAPVDAVKEESNANAPQAKRWTPGRRR